MIQTAKFVDKIDVAKPKSAVSRVPPDQIMKKLTSEI